VNTRPTLEAVAERAGVSRGTVSRVINDSPRVSARTRETVLAVVEELGYVPNHAARTLVTRRTDTVALVVSESEERVFTEPFFAGVLRGIGTALSAAGLQLLLAMAQSAAERARLERYLAGHHVDGVLMLSQHDHDTLPALVTRLRLPLVLGGHRQRALVYVDVDNVGGAHQAVAYLAASGRRAIATITGSPDMRAGRDRLTGYRDGLEEAGLALDDGLVGTGDFGPESAARAMGDLLDQRPDLDAVFAASDPMALEAVRVLRSRGRRVPEDVAVIGFDDSDLARHADPPLTTVHQPVERMGQEMARLLIAQMNGMPVPRPVVLPAHLEVRGTA
jgi:DNA-binding LacI/PurR family transcriptional regulator